jgi:hypothetical protein
MALFTIAKLRNYPRCPSVEEWIMENVEYISNEVLFSHKEE